MNTQNVKTAATKTTETWAEGQKSNYYLGDGFTSAEGYAEEVRNYWLNREAAALKAPVEIDVHRFHDALGTLYPLNWASSENGNCETFMFAEMYCGEVTEIYARIGVRYFCLRNYNHMTHAQIIASVKEAFDLNQK
ncbi:hypothetical protein ACNY68_21540 [Pantoea sp. KXB25]|uniref:hypothetical protein n=1 Tax=unclassified Pantoea TaxID=2630326 RepID=UPI003AB6E384